MNKHRYPSNNVSGLSTLHQTDRHLVVDRTLSRHHTIRQDCWARTTSLPQVSKVPALLAIDHASQTSIQHASVDQCYDHLLPLGVIATVLRKVDPIIHDRCLDLVHLPPTHFLHKVEVSSAHLDH